MTACFTVACVSTDPPPGGKGGHPSIMVEGGALVGLCVKYIDGEFGNLQTAFNQLINAEPPQINTGIQGAIQGYITQSQAYFDAGSYSCSLNTLWNGVQYVNALVNNPATSGDFIALSPPRVGVHADNDRRAIYEYAGSAELHVLWWLVSHTIHTYRRVDDDDSLHGNADLSGRRDESDE